MAIDRSVVVRLVADVSGFNGRFEQASRSVSSMEKRVAAMNREVRQAAAEVKVQASATAGAAQRMEAARRMEAAATERAKAAESGLSGLRKGAKAHADAASRAEKQLNLMRDSNKASASQISSAEQRLNAARARSRASSQALADAETRVKSARDAQASANARVKNAETALTAERQRSAAAERAHAEAAQRSIQRTQAWGNAASKMIAVGGAMAIGIGYAAKQYMDFDAAMSGVRANLSGSAAEMASVQSAVREAGASTAYSAVEAANAAEELAKAGMSAAQITGGALKGALDLAAAGGLGLARSAEVIATEMAQFKGQGLSAARATDVLAAAALGSTADVETLYQGLAQGGGAAAAMGMSFEETAGTLALFDQNALKGSDGGTSLKTMLQRLTPQSKEAGAAMKEVGLNAYDANGNFIGLQAVAQQLKTGMSGMSQESRNAAMNVIFGSDAVRAANILYQQGAAGLQRYIDMVSQSGVAAQVAAAKQNNLKGDLEKLKGSVQDVLIGAGEGANGALRPLIQNLDSIVSWFGRLSPGAQSASIQIAAFGSAGLLATGGIIKVVSVLRQVKSGLSSFKADLVSAGGAFKTWATGGQSGVTILEGLKGKAKGIGDEFDRMGRKGKVGAGLAAAALVALTAAAAASGDAVENAGRRSEQLATDLERVTVSGKGFDDIFRNLQIAAAADSSFSFAEAMKSLKGGFDHNTEGADRFAAQLFKLTGVAKGADGPAAAIKDRIKGLGDQLADLVNSGHTDQAAAQFAAIQKEAAQYGVTQGDLMKLMPSYSDALSRAARVEKQHEAATNQAALAAVKAKKATEEQKKQVEDLSSAYKNLNNVLLEQRGGARGYQAAIDDATTALKENGRTLDIGTEKGRANQEALDQIASSAGEWAASVLKSTGDQQRANSVLQQGRSEYMRMAMAMGMPREQAAKLAQELIKIDGVNTADVKVNGVEAATFALDKMGQQIVKLKGSKVTVPADTPNAPHVIQTLEALGLTAKNLSSDKTKVTIPTKALNAPGTRAAIMSIAGATKDAKGNVTIPTSALNSKATMDALRKIKTIAVQSNGQIVRIPASMPNGANVKRLIEGIRGAQLVANGKKVTVTSSAPLSAETRKKILAIKGAQVSADKKSVTIPTSSATAPNTKRLIDAIRSSQQKTNGKQAKVTASAPGADSAKSKIDKVGNSADRVNGKKARVTIEQVFTKVGEAAKAIGSFLTGGAAGGPVNQLPPRRFASGGTTRIGSREYSFMDGRVGGQVHAPGSGVSDQAITMTSNGPVRSADGEHILTAHEVALAGGHAAIYRLRAGIRSGRIRGFASGGATDGSDWSPDMSAIMQLAGTYKVEKSRLDELRKSIAEQQKAITKANEAIAKAYVAQAKQHAAAAKAPAWMKQEVSSLLRKGDFRGYGASLKGGWQEDNKSVDALLKMRESGWKPSVVSDMLKKLPPTARAVAESTLRQMGVLKGRTKAEQDIAAALAKQAASHRSIVASQAELARLQPMAKLDTTGRFLKATSSQNAISAKFLDNIDRIRRRGFPSVARTLLEQGDSDAVAIAQTLVGGPLAKLQQADRGLRTSDQLADRKKKLADQLAGVDKQAQADALKAQREANAQLIALRAANNRTAFQGGVIKVEAPKIDYGELAQKIRIDLPHVRVDSHLDGTLVGSSVTSWQESQAGMGEVVPGLRI